LTQTNTKHIVTDVIPRQILLSLATKEIQEGLLVLKGFVMKNVDTMQVMVILVVVSQNVIAVNQ
jgi:hypothetical protein